MFDSFETFHACRDRLVISGDTYPHLRSFKKSGFKWDPARKLWHGIPSEAAPGGLIELWFAIERGDLIIGERASPPKSRNQSASAEDWRANWDATKPDGSVDRTKARRL